MVPSQNPDGQLLVIDHWYKTKGTPFQRVFPDLYHKYVGHDDNRDWFMFTQKETRMNIELVQNKYKPIITHDMHQQGGNGARIFVPPFTEPFDPNMHPLLRMQQNTVGQAMAHALLSEGKKGVSWEDNYDMWSPARQYMVYHGQPRILTEIANSNLADPVKSANGRPLGPQESRAHFPVPYTKDTWTLGQQVDYGVTVALAGMTEVAKYGRNWLMNFYRVNRDMATGMAGAVRISSCPPISATRSALYEMLDILQFGAVEIHRATAAFNANGKQYPAGSFVIKTAQPYGGFANTMLSQPGVSRPAPVPGRTARAALRRHRPHAVDVDRRQRRLRGQAVRCAARAREESCADDGDCRREAEERVPDRAGKLRHVQDDRAAAEGQRAGVSRIEGVR